MTLSTTTTTEPSKALYRTSPIKRRRRTNVELDALADAVIRITGEDPPITIRHLFYRLVGEQMLQKDERKYAKLCAPLAKWRRQGRVDFDVFPDATRFYRGPTMFDDIKEALDNTVECYRKNLWTAQPHHVEVWCEKDAISNILAEEATAYCVQTFLCRGFASLSSLANAAATFRRARAAGKEVHIFYFGDHDPSGRAIDRAAERTLADDFGVIVDFRRIAVTQQQIEQLGLPTRPVKDSDTRAKGWSSGCMEIDTMKPSVLRKLVSDGIVSLIDARSWKILEKREQEERESAAAIWRPAA